MKSRLIILLQGAKSIFQTEGLLSLSRRAFIFLKNHFLRYGTCYIYHEMLDERNEADFLPKVDNFSLKVVYTNQQADDLAAHGLEFRSPGIIDKDRLDRGAIAFCIFVGGELAHINWVAITEQAKAGLAWFPCKVDFSKKQAYDGTAITNQKFRGLGLWSYCYFKIRQFLMEKGIVEVIYVVVKDNIDHQRRLAKKLGVKPYAEARYLRILCWKYWKEEPITQTLAL